MRFRAGVLAVLLAASGCSTLGGGTGPTIGDPPPPGSGKASMDGGLINGTVGEGLSNSDRRKALEAEYRALEYTQSGQAVAWSGSGGRSGEVTPAQPYRVGSQDCRQYTQKVVVDGKGRTARGTACRNADGSWATLT